MVEWVDIRPIFDVCTRETGYNIGGDPWVLWWRQAVGEKQLKVMVEDILVAAKERCRQKFGRRGKSEGGAEGGVTDRNG